MRNVRWEKNWDVEEKVFGGCCLTWSTAAVLSLASYIYGVVLSFGVHVYMGIASLFPVCGIAAGVAKIFGYNIPLELAKAMGLM